jgi:hypothetical protein
LFIVTLEEGTVVFITEVVRFPVAFVLFMDVALVRFIFVGGTLVCANIGLRL